MANPPFNVSGVDKERLEDDPRFPFGLPRPDIANYIWIQTFYSALNETGRASFVMANSAGDARGTELECAFRRKVASDSDLIRPPIPTQSGQSDWGCDRARWVIL